MFFVGFLNQEKKEKQILHKPEQIFFFANFLAHKIEKKTGVVWWGTLGEI